MSIEEKRPEESFYTDRYALGKNTLPIAFNTSEEQFERERDKLFRRAWLIVGRVEEVAKPGDFFVQDIPTLKTSVITVRGRDGKIRSFHNMCKHRGNRVIYPGVYSGRAKGFSCGFHGWTYDTAGKLVIVPDEDQFYDLDKSENGLTEITTEVWENFIWINTDPRESLKDWLGELWDHYGGSLTTGRYENFRLFSHTVAREINCNWKVILDAFSEGYHVPFIHGKTLPEALTGTSNPLCHLLDAKVYKRHRSFALPANPEYQPTPLEMKLFKFLDMPVFPALSSDLDKLPQGVNEKKDPYWGADSQIVFPTNQFGVWANGSILLYNFWPISVDKTAFVVKLYWDQPKNAAELINQEMTRAMTVSVVREDMSSLETTQEALNSGAADVIHLSDQEVLVRHSYKVLHDYLDAQAD